jgi:hypothetical protein
MHTPEENNTFCSGNMTGDPTPKAMDPIQTISQTWVSSPLSTGELPHQAYTPLYIKTQRPRSSAYNR